MTYYSSSVEKKVCLQKQNLLTSLLLESLWHFVDSVSLSSSITNLTKRVFHATNFSKPIISTNTKMLKLFVKNIYHMYVLNTMILTNYQKRHIARYVLWK